MSAMVIVYLFRHGRTGLNAAGLLRGRVDEPLDDEGLREAKRLGSLFAPVRLDAVLSSPLSRSVDTARAIAEPHGMSVTIDRNFIDRDYGPWAGKTRDEVESRYGSLDEAPADEIEASASLERRVVAALTDVIARFPGKVIAIVGHDAINRAIIRSVCKAWRDREDELPQPTGCWNKLVAEGRSISCDVVGALPGDGVRPDENPESSRAPAD